MPSRKHAEELEFSSLNDDGPPTKVTVRVISHKGPSAMIECSLDGLLKRFVIAYNLVVDGQADISDLEQAAPYGLPIGELLPKIQYDPRRLEQACRERGLWTAEDFVRNPSLVQGALQDALRLDAGTILNLALKHKE
jgi:hypothetical protein